MDVGVGRFVVAEGFNGVQWSGVECSEMRAKKRRDRTVVNRIKAQQSKEPENEVRVIVVGSVQQCTTPRLPSSPRLLGSIFRRTRAGDARF